MNKKVLFVATIDQHIWHFHLPYLKWFKENHYEVHVASFGQMNLPFVDRKFDVCFHRSPFRLQNLKAYYRLKDIIVSGGYDIVHCHTPVASVLTRLVARNAKGLKSSILYTAHGFHFYRGAPLPYWLVFYPVEKYLSAFVDGLITINAEDFALARRHFRAKHTFHVDGIGVDLNRFFPPDDESKARWRTEYGFNRDAFILIYVGELSARKNQAVLIHAMDALRKAIPSCTLLLAGDGPLVGEYQKLAADMGVGDCVRFLGYRSDIPALMQLSDIAVTSARQEGLPVNVMEAMATGLPVVASDCRGNCDLVKDRVNGYTVHDNSPDSFSSRIIELYRHPEDRDRMKQANVGDVRRYAINSVLPVMSAIYGSFV
jgi:glycosyltransferase EpsD